MIHILPTTERKQVTGGRIMAVDKNIYWLKSDIAVALGMSLSKLKAVEKEAGFPKPITVINPETGTEYTVYHRREAESFVSQYLDEKAALCNRMANAFVVGRY